MVESVPGAVLKQLTKSLESVEWQLTNEPVPREALRDFKSAVDQIRLSAWALLEADDDVPGAIGRQGIVAQFRLARANEICSQVRDDLEVGRLPSSSDELRGLRDTVHDLADLIDHYVGNDG